MEAFMADLEVQPRYLSGRAEKETVKDCSQGSFCLSCLSWHFNQQVFERQTVQLLLSSPSSVTSYRVK